VELWEELLVKNSTAYQMMQKEYNEEIKGDDGLQNLEFELSKLKHDNAQMRYQKELLNREFETLMYDN
jgi:hypothetical protein